MHSVSIAMWPARTGHAYILCLVRCQCLELNGASKPVGATTVELLQLHAHYHRPPPTLSQLAASKMQLRKGEPSPVSPSMLFRFAARASRLVRRLFGDTGVSGEPKPSRARLSAPRLDLGGLVAGSSIDRRAVDRTSPWMRRAATDALS